MVTLHDYEGNNILKSFINNDLEKAFEDPTHGGKLMAIHIINKEGHHQTVYKTREQLQEMNGNHDHKHVEAVGVGHRVTPKTGKVSGTIVGEKVKDGAHHFSVKFDNGAKADVHHGKLNFHNPEEDPKRIAQVSPGKQEEKPDPGKEAYENDEEKLTVKERWSEYRSKIRSILDKSPKSLKSLIAYGSGGVGKTFSLMDEIDKNNKKYADDPDKQLIEGRDFVKLTGAASAKGMFDFMKANSDKLIIFDDCDDVLKDEDAINILKSANDTSDPREITWGGKLKEGETSADQTFPFTGKVVFISNLPSDKIPQPLKSRGERINLTMSKSETIDTIKNIIESPRGLNFRNVSGSQIPYSKEDKMDAVNWLDENKDRIGELSVRTIGKVLAIKRFYEKNKEDWKPAAERILIATKDTDDINDRFKDYENSAEIVANGAIKSMIVYGTGGLGKTYTLVQKLKELGFNKTDSGVSDTEENEEGEKTKKSVDKDYVHFKGAKITARGLYERLFQNNGKLLIFDDSDSVLKDPRAQNVLKGALDTSGDGSVAWMSSQAGGGKEKKTPKQKKSESDEDYKARMVEGGFVDENGDVIDNSVPSEFKFNGRVIFVSNLEKDYMDKSLQPLMSRALTTNMTMNADQTIDRMDNLVNEKNWEGAYSTASKEDKNHVINYLKEVKDKISTDDLNMRTLDKLVRIKVSADKENKEYKDDPDHVQIDWKRKVKNELFQKSFDEDEISKSFDNLFKAKQNKPLSKDGVHGAYYPVKGRYNEDTALSKIAEHHGKGIRKAKTNEGHSFYDKRDRAIGHLVKGTLIIKNLKY